MSFKLYIHYRSLRVKSYPKTKEESQFYDNKHDNDRGDINNVNTSQHVGGEFFSLVTNERNWWRMLFPVLVDVLWGSDTWTLILVIKPGSLHSAPVGEAEWLFELLAWTLSPQFPVVLQCLVHIRKLLGDGKEYGRNECRMAPFVSVCELTFEHEWALKPSL